MPILVETPVVPGVASGMPKVAILGDSGIVLNEVDGYGLDWLWAGDDPWSPGPAPRQESGDRSYGDGQWDATRWWGPRTINIAGQVVAPTPDALQAGKQRFMAAIGIKPWSFHVVEPGGFDRRATVRRQGEVMWTEDMPNRASWSASLFAPDPFIYGATPVSFTSSFPSLTGGLVWPATWPETWDATVTSGRAFLINEGTEPAYPLIRITGPASDVSISQPSTGRVLTIANPDGPTLNAGEWLDVDMRRRQVLLLDTGHRRSWARGQWLTIPPGESELQFGSSGAGVGAGISGEFDHTWI